MVWRLVPGCLAIVLAGCSHHGNTPEQGLSVGSPRTRITGPTTDYEYATPAAEIELSGTLGKDDTPVAWNSETSWQVWAEVVWTNLDLQQSGECPVVAHIECLPLLGCGLVDITWTCTVPLQFGDNHIRVTTTDTLDGSVGTDEMLVHCAAAAWAPVVFLVFDSSGVVERHDRWLLLR